MTPDAAYLYVGQVSPRIRFATTADATSIERIENDADRLLIDRLEPDAWSPAPPGAERITDLGFVLVAEVDEDVVGFVHVLEIDDACHLEQLSVSPAFARRGLGRALTEAAKRHAGERGHSRITLRTFADVPWNAPFYATVGFAEEEPSTAFHRSLVEVEARLGLDRYGRRVQMGATLRPASAVH
ncbi:GNAT family N-acetyltransferase [Microbacterium sp. LMI1x-1-1.1]